MDRQKKELHSNVTFTECTGDVRVLVGLPRAAAEVPKEYFSSQGVPPEKCEV